MAEIDAVSRPDAVENEQLRPNESELWAWLENAASESARVRREEAQFDVFEKHLDMYHGRHWPLTVPSYRPPIVVNELRTLILSEASDLSDTGFRPYIMKDPRKGNRDEEAERALRALWVRQQIDLKIIEAVTWAEIIGTGFLRVNWDPDAYYGMGDVTIEVVDPRFILPDPDAADETPANAMTIVESYMDLYEIRRLFPKYGYDVKPEDRYSEKDTTDVQSKLTPGPSFMSPLSAQNDSLLGRSYPGYKKARARVLDAVIKDDKIEEVTQPMLDENNLPRKNEEGAPVLETFKRMKYPKGRRIVGANGVILLDQPNANPHGSSGIIRVVLEPTLGRYWGTGFVQQTGELQLAADKMMSAIVENAIRLNNGIVKVTGNTAIDWETFTGAPAQIVQLNQGSDFDIKYPPPMPPDMVQAPWRMLDMQRRILGFPEPRMGQGGRGNVSPELTETEIAQSQGTTRLRAKHLYHVVQRLAEMIFAFMCAFYTIERAIPAVEGEQFKPIVWHPVEDPERYAVYVDPASFQVMSRSMLRRLCLALLKMGAIDRKAALEQLGWPDWERVAQRIDQAEVQALAAKLQAKKK